jgi:drug/metabolite transporter (DMT)-like permease
MTDSPGTEARRNAGSARALDYALLGVLATLWGTSYTWIKIALQTMAPLTLVAGRLAIATVLLCVFVPGRLRALRPDAPTMWRLALQACLNCIVPFSLLAFAMRRLDASTAVVLNSTAPIFAFVLAAATREERVTVPKLVGTILGFGGILAIVGLHALRSGSSALGAELGAIAAAGSYACAVVAGKRFEGHDPFAVAAVICAMSALVLVPVAAAAERPWTHAVSARSIGAMIMLASASTAGAYGLYFHLVRTLGALGTSAQAYLRVPIGVVVGAVLLHESISPATIMGSACVILGAAAMSLGARRATPGNLRHTRVTASAKSTTCSEL